MSVDPISEFSVLTTNYSTEYGRTSGGVDNAITKSGTKVFHGDVFEYLRNPAWMREIALTLQRFRLPGAIGSGLRRGAKTATTSRQVQFALKLIW